MVNQQYLISGSHDTSKIVLERLENKWDFFFKKQRGKRNGKCDQVLKSFYLIFQFF